MSPAPLTLREVTEQYNRLRAEFSADPGVTLLSIAALQTHVRMLVGWCELRQGFRHFRTDRIRSLTIEPQRYPRRRQALLKQWREVEGIASA